MPCSALGARFTYGWWVPQAAKDAQHKLEEAMQAMYMKAHVRLHLVPLKLRPTPFFHTRLTRWVV